jgi:ABC-type dipeptide/oligopeptide/nickel transport system ATPase component
MHIKKRLQNLNRNWLAVIVGETGSGKSFLALKLGQLIDPEFNITKVVFSPSEFMKLITSGILRKGDCIVWDEAGVSVPAREWYSISNKSINYIAQTFRHDNLAVIFTVPNFDYIDSQLRKLFHTYIETQHINRVKKLCRVKWLNISYDGRTKKLYMKYPRVNIRGVDYKIKKVGIGLPTQELQDDYEKKKRKFTDKLKRSVEGNIKMAEELQEKKFS